MVKSTEAELEHVEEANGNESKVEKSLEAARPNTSSEEIVRLPEKSKEGSDEETEHGE